MYGVYIHGCTWIVDVWLPCLRNPVRSLKSQFGGREMLAFLPVIHTLARSLWPPGILFYFILTSLLEYNCFTVGPPGILSQTQNHLAKKV